MFGSFPTLDEVNPTSQLTPHFYAANLPPQAKKIDPKDIPPPTPISIPRYLPFAQDDHLLDPASSLPNLLKQTGRSTAGLGPIGFTAIGLDLSSDASIHDIVPDPSFVPDFRRWERLTADESREENQASRRPLRTGNQSPGCQVYLERKKELSNSNKDAFRTVRRISPPKGRQQARLGNAYEFFRCLELLTVYWDDPTDPPDLPPSPERSDAAEVAAADATHEPSADGSNEPETPTVTRTSSGQSMPAEFRQTLITAFVKLVTYDFGCNVSMSRVEPRLHLNSPPGPRMRKSYTPCHCHFIFQSPMTRESARAGMVYGPVAAVSIRPTVNFTSPDVETAQSLDLAREVTAALIAAQHRAREGKTEVRFGEGQWWTSKPRWGGGSGGPIGREVDKDAVQGDKDARPGEADANSAPVTKKPRKTMSVYDNYRMVRLPSSAWDRKAKYEAIGKTQGADYDDIFVISSLFHHISFLRVRVPNRLLEVMDGSPEPDASKRSWGKVQAWRSPWYDLFATEQRVVAMQLLWAVMSYQMRKDSSDNDVSMAGA
ncbi:hypothetical protein O9K51_06689 [Purpureocillium lavendulum]|uniref:Uncharacterized protein n=1 Tax=Purpureocillium lavendulum TaxID=1247861 RepID=A0AB34FRC7_9HYPO|nr:hypothetical protein O9K51_06689 [Purpureocillium lavendulum]